MSLSVSTKARLAGALYQLQRKSYIDNKVHKADLVKALSRVHNAVAIFQRNGWSIIPESGEWVVNSISGVRSTLMKQNSAVLEQKEKMLSEIEWLVNSVHPEMANNQATQKYLQKMNAEFITAVCKSTEAVGDLGGAILSLRLSASGSSTRCKHRCPSDSESSFSGFGGNATGALNENMSVPFDGKVGQKSRSLIGRMWRAITRVYRSGIRSREAANQSEINLIGNEGLAGCTPTAVGVSTSKARFQPMARGSNIVEGDHDPAIGAIIRGDGDKSFLSFNRSIDSDYEAHYSGGNDMKNVRFSENDDNISYMSIICEGGSDLRQKCEYDNFGDDINKNMGNVYIEHCNVNGDIYALPSKKIKSNLPVNNSTGLNENLETNFPKQNQVSSREGIVSRLRTAFESENPNRELEGLRWRFERDHVISS